VFMKLTLNICNEEECVFKKMTVNISNEEMCVYETDI